TCLGLLHLFLIQTVDCLLQEMVALPLIISAMSVCFQNDSKPFEVRDNPDGTLVAAEPPPITLVVGFSIPRVIKVDNSLPPTVGPLRVEVSDLMYLEQIRQELLLVDRGHYKPPQCLSVQKVAVIIPYRHREQHLKYWLYYLHPILQRQQLEYGVYVIEQDGEDTFNRAKLLNVGYAEALNDYNYDCFVFSDVDIIPMDDRNTYRCHDQPRHLAVALDKFGFRLPYNQIFGGISAMSKDQYLKINGFPNNYWGWGGEDDDISNRSTAAKLTLLETMDTDGINSLTYNVVKVEKDQLFTKITVDIGKP
uniref:Beta-1,4-galactosyltransferase n=1 Tax=Electrophorus electricus TaxID=8005 RepID=A0AAY5F5V3_ELEEL